MADDEENLTDEEIEENEKRDREFTKRVAEILAGKGFKVQTHVKIKDPLEELPD